MPSMRRDLKPEIIRPRDFASFWKNTLIELGQSNPDLSRESVPHDQDQELKLEKISFVNKDLSTIDDDDVAKIKTKVPPCRLASTTRNDVKKSLQMEFDPGRGISCVASSP